MNADYLKDSSSEADSMTKILTQHFDEPKLHELETYRRLGGYKGLEKALSMSRRDVTEEVKKSNLRGLGGAGFPTGGKWETVPPEEKSPGPRYVVVNCDESEPGCFKDRVLVTRAPHQVIARALIARTRSTPRTLICARRVPDQHDIRESDAEAEAAGYLKHCTMADAGRWAYISASTRPSSRRWKARWPGPASLALPHRLD